MEAIRFKARTKRSVFKKTCSASTGFLSMFPAVAIAWGAVIWTQSVLKAGQVTLVLRWPLAPFVIVEVIGASLLAVVVVVKLVNSFRVRRD